MCAACGNRRAGAAEQQQRPEEAGAMRASVTPLVGHCVAQLQHGRNVWALAVLEGGRLLSGGNNTHLRVWDIGACVGVASMKGFGIGIAPLPGGRFAACGGSSRTVDLWDLETRVCLGVLRGHEGDVYCGASLSGGILATGSCDTTIRLWDVDTGAHVASLTGHSDSVRALVALPNGLLASGSQDNSIRLWDVAARSCVSVLQHANSVNALIAIDETHLASGCGDSQVYIWALAGGVLDAQLKGHTSFVSSLAALPRGLLASGSEDKTVRVWDVAARACVAVLRGHRGDVMALAALPDGRLASGSDGDDGEIRVWVLCAPGSEADAVGALMAQAAAPAEPRA